MLIQYLTDNSKYKKVLIYYNEVIEIHKKLDTINNPSITNLNDIIFNYYFDQTNWKESLKILNYSQQILEENKMTETVKYYALLNNLGLINYFIKQLTFK